MSNFATSGVFPTLTDLQASRPVLNSRLELSTGERYRVEIADKGENILLANGFYANTVNVIRKVDTNLATSTISRQAREHILNYFNISETITLTAASYSIGDAVQVNRMFPTGTITVTLTDGQVFFDPLGGNIGSTIAISGASSTHVFYKLTAGEWGMSIL